MPSANLAFFSWLFNYHEDTYLKKTWEEKGKGSVVIERPMGCRTKFKILYEDKTAIVKTKNMFFFLSLKWIVFLFVLFCFWQSESLMGLTTFSAYMLQLHILEFLWFNHSGNGSYLWLFCLILDPFPPIGLPHPTLIWGNVLSPTATWFAISG